MAVRNKPRNRLNRIIQRRIGLKPGERYTGKEIQAMEKGAQPQVIARQRRIQRIMERNPDWAFNLRSNLEQGARWDREHTWKINRSYRHYDFAFSRALERFNGRTLIDALATLAPKNRPLRILEDGAGEGNFSKGAKRKLEAREIKVEATALSLGKNEKLAEKEAKGEIDKVIEKPAEFFIPEGKYDAIVSVAGSIEYAGIRTSAEHLLKYCYSLEKRGIALIAFEIQQNTSLTTTRYFPQEISAIKERVKKRLKKAGFEAEFYDMDKLYNLGEFKSGAPEWKLFDQTPPNILIIRRKR